MRISVDLPAPFSPTSACASPVHTSSDAPRLACTGRKYFSTSRISTVGARTVGADGARSSSRTPLASAGDGDAPGDDVAAQPLHARAHRVRDQRVIALVIGVADAFLPEAVRVHATLEGVRGHAPDDVEGDRVHALHHRRHDVTRRLVPLV